MAITMNELLSGQCTFEQCTPIQKSNLNILLEKINAIRIAYAKPMTVSSGLRTMTHHLEIYAKKGITDKSKIPMKSRHLTGQAVDIKDVNGELKKWVLKNVDLLSSIGLWCEAFVSTPTWIHFQIIPPASGKRFFNP